MLPLLRLHCPPRLAPPHIPVIRLRGDASPRLPFASFPLACPVACPPARGGGAPVQGVPGYGGVFSPFAPRRMENGGAGSDPLSPFLEEVDRPQAVAVAASLSSLFRGRAVWPNRFLLCLYAVGFLVSWRGCAATATVEKLGWARGPPSPEPAASSCHSVFALGRFFPHSALKVAEASTLHVFRGNL